MEENRIKSISNYQIVETIRKTSEGVFYSAIENTSEKRVLIKVYYPSLRWSEGTLIEFFNLTSYLQFIEHEYLLPILDVGKYEDLPYIVFPGDLTAFLYDYDLPQTNQEILEFFRKIADALDFLHKQEILHGTLNPEKIIIDVAGDPKLFDYGLSGVFKKLLVENLDEYFDNLSVSNLKCTSPEQILGRNPTRSSDVYSFGIVSYFCTFGEFPFNGRFTPEIAISHRDQKMLRIEKVLGNISNNTLQFIQKCIQVEPEARFASFAQILGVLDRMKAGKKARFPFKKRFLMGKFAPRRAWWYAVAALCLAGLISLNYFYSHNFAPQSVISQSTAPTIPSTSIHNAIQATDSQQLIVTDPPTEQIPVTESVSTESVPTQTDFKPAFEDEMPNIPSQTISLSNIKDIREYARLGYGKPEDAAVFQDKNFFALATSAGVFIFDNNQFLKWIDPKDWVTSVEFSKDGTRLAIGVNSGDIQLWDWKGDLKLITLSGHTAKINRILFSENDQFLYSASSDQHIIVWNLSSRTIIRDILAHSDPINDIAVSSDGRTLITCSDDRLIRVWNLATGEKLYEVSFDGKVKAVAISLDDLFLAAGGESGYVRQWNIITRQLRNDPIPVGEKIWSLQYLGNSNELLVGVNNGNARKYNAAQLKYEGVSRGFEFASIPTRLSDIFGAGFDFDSYSIAYGGNNVISIRWDGRVTNQNQQLQILSPMYDNLDRLDFSEDGTILAAGGKRGITSVWDLANNRVIYRDQFALPWGNPISPDGSSIAILAPKTIIISSTTGVPVIRDIYQLVALSSTRPIKDLSEAIPGGTVSYARDGSIFISGSLTQSKSWDFASGYETFFNGYANKGCWITASANNKEILQVNSAAGVFLAVEEYTDNICAKSFQHRGELSALSDDLQFMVFINVNGLIEGFDLLLDQSMWRYKPDFRVTALAASPDGSIVAFGNETGKLIFIDGKTGEYLTETVGNFGSLQAIEFSADGTKIATAGKDGTARLFGIVELK